MRFGFHISITGGFKKVVARALEKHCQTIQFFSRNPRGWDFNRLDPKDIQEFQIQIKNTDISPLFIHMPYLPNLSSTDKILYKKSFDSLTAELKRCEIIGAQFLITHIGKRMDSSEQKALLQISECVNKAFNKIDNRTILLLENTASMGSEIGYNFTQIKEIINRVEDKSRLGIVLDTAHMFGAGYPIHTRDGLNQTLKEFDKLIGMQKLHLIHLNDSKTELGSRVDRHEHIGKGKIGLDGMKNIINHPLLKHLPAIMETPKEDEQDDAKNMRVVKSLVIH